MAKKTKKKKADRLLVKRPLYGYEDFGFQQRYACDLIHDWLFSEKHSDNIVFRLGGVAGSAKSTIIAYLIEKYGWDTTECYVVAYTGQAVNVLRQKGIMAKTIHSTFMKCIEEPITDKNGKILEKRGVPITKIKFVPLKSIPSTVKLIICDEASFLDVDMEKLMLKYNVPILEVGDPIQLPPVSGKQCFHMENLDYFIDTIMRQDADSEIIQFATAIRNYEPIRPDQFGNDITFLIGQHSSEATFYRFKPFIRAADMLITSTNKERQIMTDLYRKEILKTDSPFPIKGERMICRKNDWYSTLGPYPLTNGTQGYAVRTVGKSEVDERTRTFYLDFQPAFVGNTYYEDLNCDTKFLREPFGQDKANMNAITKNPAKKFEYAHAITAHLAQGAQYPTVMFFDHFNKDNEYHMRVRYTVATRAESRLIWVIPYYKKAPGWTDLWKGGFKPDD